ncbi:hypothetical protein PCANC_18727 [Puccinia coronata f. sp. avenae]|uniref:Kynurenine formamidase n=1 Tax=Puccinia coronata f. sp. avenae TaxID=200324 RepID=A0A2N5V0B1_9BASI|nr:hypothetical protein PCANC_18727 [Puccinia coronata f. sp. avenae]PLW43435.1 hypothetical protein PCASD_07539 [Puccinia coronata f. sp. avenae]
MTSNHRLLGNLTYPGGIPPYQCFDVYIPSTAPPSLDQLIIYVHGGAWRSGDKANAHSIGLIRNLSDHFPTAAICSVNYRLSIGKVNPTSDVKHPSHNMDVARAINHAISLPELKNTQNVFLIGHSVGAFMCLSLAGILEPSCPEAPHLSSSTCEKIRGLVLIDGIYDLVKLLEQYPEYKEFVVAAFGEETCDRLQDLQQASPLSWTPKVVDPKTLPRILILHSRQDSLLTILQSELAATALKSKLSLGDNDVETDFDSVSGDHDDLLLSPKLGSRIKSFIAGNSD